jgi:heparan sulfate 2-O-sulfotransferase HS2ST1
MVSHYYYLRYGDDFAPNRTMSKMGDNTTFDECIAKKKNDCSTRKLWVQVPFFCGHEAACWQPGSKWALQRAKEHLMSNYLLVGVTEQLPEFIAVLETTVPQFFRGASQLFNEMQKKIPSGYLRQTAKKEEPHDETVLHIKRSEVYRMERQFYEFAKVRFEIIKKRTLKDDMLINYWNS